ncbi:MAG: hypothetical protein GKR88_15010 [Flavobacteriaceae bacterium]|nr:MAG: hypothetical protein GKR88_15010 [Flavobacteriaceae bacterium]
MSTAELRNKWQKSIHLVDDKFIRMIDTLYETYTKEDEVDFFDELPKQVQELLMISREQVKQGKVTPHKDVMAKYREKYNVAG